MSAGWWDGTGVLCTKCYSTGAVSGGLAQVGGLVGADNERYCDPLL